MPTPHVGLPAVKEKKLQGRRKEERTKARCCNCCCWSQLGTCWSAAVSRKSGSFLAPFSIIPRTARGGRYIWIPLRAQPWPPRPSKLYPDPGHLRLQRIQSRPAHEPSQLDSLARSFWLPSISPETRYPHREHPSLPSSASASRALIHRDASGAPAASTPTPNPSHTLLWLPKTRRLGHPIQSILARVANRASTAAPAPASRSTFPPRPSLRSPRPLRVRELDVLGTVLAVADVARVRVRGIGVESASWREQNFAVLGERANRKPAPGSAREASRASGERGRAAQASRARRELPQAQRRARQGKARQGQARQRLSRDFSPDLSSPRLHRAICGARDARARRDAQRGLQAARTVAASPRAGPGAPGPRSGSPRSRAFADPVRVVPPSHPSSASPAIRIPTYLLGGGAHAARVAARPACSLARPLCARPGRPAGRRSAQLGRARRGKQTSRKTSRQEQFERTIDGDRFSNFQSLNQVGAARRRRMEGAMRGAPARGRGPVRRGAAAQPGCGRELRRRTRSAARGRRAEMEMEISAATSATSTATLRRSTATLGRTAATRRTASAAAERGGRRGRARGSGDAARRKPRVMLAAICAVLVVFEAVARQGLTLAAPPAMAGESLDSDGDGRVSDSELAGSSFFKKVDTDDDGTLSGSELLRVAQRFNVGDVMDIEQGVRDAVQHVNQDEKSGIQVNDLSSHWRRLTSLATPEEVAEWVEHAVLLPRYADAFRENSVKGFDLPMLLEDAELLQDLGVDSRFHVRQIQRAISVRLFGLASLPGAPHISCERSRDDPEHVIARWDLSETEAPPDSGAHVPRGSEQGNDGGEKTDKQASGSEGSPRSLPIHRLRVFARTTDGMGKSKPWRPAGVLDDLGTHKLTVTGVPANANVELRIEAWNAVGRSAYSYARCGSASDRKSAPGSEKKPESKLPRNGSEPLNTPVPKQTTSTNHHDRSHDSDFMPEPDGKLMRDVFSNADLDGDGDIDGTELRQYVNELSEGIEKRPGAEVSPRETELRKFIESRGVEVGIAAMDDDEDAVILPTEFELRWKGMQRLMTASKTADWIANAVELPQYADKFRDNGFTGFELAQLIGKHGDERLHELGIHDAHHRSLITRAISVLFMGLGTAPTQHFYLEPQPGDTCGSIKLKWTKMGHAVSPKDELPIHKYRVLRREANAPDSDPWVTVYSGLSTSAEDLHLNTRKKYLYRVEAWNLIGVSPASETLPISPNLEACVSVVDMFWRLVKNILLLPITLFTLVIDNYYRIMAAASVLGGLMLFSNTPAWEKVRLLRGVRERFTLMLKSHFGTAFGLDLALTKLIKYFERRAQIERQMNQQDDDNPITPRSPHHDIVSRAVEAAFPSMSRGGNGSNRGWLGRGSGRNPVGGPQPSASAPPRVLHPATLEATRERGESTHLQRHISIPLSPSSESKWEIVKRHVVLKRAVNAFKASVYDLSSFQSDTDNSSQISSDNANASPANGKTKRAKIGSTIRKRTTKALSSPIDLIKGLASQDSRSTTPSPPPAAAPPTSVRRQMMLSAGGSSSIEANVRRCGRCNEKVSSHSRHTCGGCHLVFCKACTAYKSHGKLRSCDVESKCRCVDCVQAEKSYVQAEKSYY